MRSISTGKIRTACDEVRERERRVREEVPLRPCAEEPDADAEEAAQQHEVAEVREVDDVGAGPADERQLDEEHQGS